MAVGLAAQGGIDVDVIAGLTTRVQGAHLVGHSVVTRQHRADVQDSRWILPPVDAELDFELRPDDGSCTVRRAKESFSTSSSTSRSAARYAAIAARTTSGNACSAAMVDGTVVVEGGGKAAAALLANVPWIRAADHVVYWGDIDADGYAILDRFRATLAEPTPDGAPAKRVDSILMNAADLHRYAEHGVNHDKAGRPLGPPVRPSRT